MIDDGLNVEQDGIKATTSGGYVIDINDSGVYLTISSPDSGVTSINENSIFEELTLKKIDNYNRNLVITAIKEGTGQAVKIADKAVPKTVIAPDIRVLVARDRMEASLEVHLPAGSRSPEFNEIIEKIQSNGVVFGVDHEAVKRAQAHPGNTVICAKGRQPVNGTNSSIKYYVETDKKGRPEERADGSVDFKHLSLFVMVQQGDLLAEKIPSTPGESGIDVLGNTLVAKPGKDMPIPMGKNVQIVDSTTLVASISGQILLSNNKLSVVPVIEIKEDVDVSTGNIEFIGDVTIRGSVQPGFSVKADGNIEIYGTISGGTVEGKNVVIKMGIQGMHRGYVKAQENVIAKFIENATVHAGMDIIVSDVVLNSRVSSGKKVIVEGKRGLIVGGTIMAGEEIRAKVVGTHMNTMTALEVGVNPALREEYQHIRSEIKKVQVNAEKTQKAVVMLKSMDQSSLPPDKREMLLKLTKAQFHLTGQAETMRNRLNVIQDEFDSLRDGRIKVAEVIYPGVKVVVGTLVKPIGEPLKFVSLYAVDGELKIGSFK